jgi:uncharacterized metal-binding protein
MPSGKTHDWVTLVLLPAVFVVGRNYLHWGWTDCVLLTLGTWVGGSLLSPDLDTRSRPFYRWGIFRFIWWPYQWSIRHRASASHGLILAPWFRLLYLSAVLVLLYTGVMLYLAHAAGLPGNIGKPRADILRFLHVHLHDILVLGCGVWMGGVLHSLLDYTVSAGKRRRR